MAFLTLLGTLAIVLGMTTASSAQGRGRPDAPASNVVYITTNDPTPGENAVLAFRRSTEDGGLTPLGRFPMRGTGAGNPDGLLGLLDSDQNLIASPDRRLLFGVNTRSDSIAVFRINSNGSLTHVIGSPFPSGGRAPVSLGLTGNQLYVIHKNEDRARGSAGALPNYTGFRVSGSGHLAPIPHSTIFAVQGSSPSQALVTSDGGFLFDAQTFVDFPADFFLTPGGGGGATLQSFRIRPNGRLAPNPPQRIPGPDSDHPDPLGLLPDFSTNGVLGLQTHPTENILYAGFVFRSQLGVYTWDEGTGVLSFEKAVNNSGLAVCWIQITSDGQRAYTSNTITNSLSRYDLSDPLDPAEVDSLVLPLKGAVTQLDLDPSGRFLYAISQRVTDNQDDPTENVLHVINIPADNEMMMSVGPGSPIQLDLPPFNLSPTARPQGVVAF